MKATSPLAGLRDLRRRGRSDTALDQQLAASAQGSDAASSSARSSILPAFRIPTFRRTDAWKSPPPHQKTPLMAMKLSSLSFLDSVVTDNHNKKTLYTMKTDGATTRITRSIAATTQFCTIRWPKALPTIIKGKMASDGVSIHLGDARWLGGENLLKRGPRPDSSRKFSLPNYSQILKWKRYGNVYWCTTVSVKGPVAVLELARDKHPTLLTIYETLHDKYDTRGVLSYHGVYIPLMDYLLVTALLLVTDLQEWMLVKQVEGRNIIVPNPSAAKGSTAVETTTTDVQWRKILYREPLFPKIASETSSSMTGISDSDSGQSPITPLSPNHKHHVYSHPSSAPAGESILSFSSSEYEGDNEGEDARPLSPSMESTFYPNSDVAPAHGYADPTYHHRKSQSTTAIPPVPPLPLEYQGQSSNQSSVISSSIGSVISSSIGSPVSPSRPLRKLPNPPATPGHLTFVSASSNAVASSSSSLRASSSSTATVKPSTTEPEDKPVSRARSLTSRAGSRPLPQAPSTSSTPSSPQIMRRARSQVFSSYSTGTEATLPYYVQEYTSPPSPPPLPTVHSPTPSQLTLSSPQSGRQRSLPPTPQTALLDPTSPPPETMQEELRAAAATIRILRQHQHIHSPTKPSRLSTSTGPEGDSDLLLSRIHQKNTMNLDEMEDADETAQWVHILTSPRGGVGGGRTLPQLPVLPGVHDCPPPAYHSHAFASPPPVPERRRGT